MIQLSKRLQAVAWLASGGPEFAEEPERSGELAHAEESERSGELAHTEESERSEELEQTETPRIRIRCVADVGTDHGYLPIWLVEQGIAERAIAMDVRTGPLQRAQEHITEHQLGAYIETRLSDGLAALHRDEAQVVVIAGMGGATMSGILEAGRSAIGPDTILVLQPQSELYEFRRYLATRNFMLLSEDMVEEDGKYYPMMKVRQKGGLLNNVAQDGSACQSGNVRQENKMFAEKPLPYTELELRYGPLLLRQKHSVLKKFLLWQLEQKERILQQIRESKQEGSEHYEQAKRRVQREQELQAEIAGIHQALSFF